MYFIIAIENKNLDMFYKGVEYMKKTLKQDKKWLKHLRKLVYYKIIPNLELFFKKKEEVEIFLKKTQLDKEFFKGTIDFMIKHMKMGDKEQEIYVTPIQDYLTKY